MNSQGKAVNIFALHNYLVLDMWPYFSKLKPQQEGRFKLSSDKGVRFSISYRFNWFVFNLQVLGF
jgi:hypothetical protein